MTFLDELALAGCYTDDWEDEHDGRTYVTPSLIGDDDRKETDSSGMVQG